MIHAEAVNGDGTMPRGRGETIYFGRSCDALIEGLGHGGWAWGAGGTIVKVGRYAVWFPHQIPAHSPGRCAL